MQLRRFHVSTLIATRNFSAAAAAAKQHPLGIIGLGSMGSKLVVNFRSALPDRPILIHDVNKDAVSSLVGGSVSAASLKEMSTSCSQIISILPNDDVLRAVTSELLPTQSSPRSSSNFVHISCSTVSPTTSRELEGKYKSVGCTLVATPVFARPDGLAKRQATWMVSGSQSGRDHAKSLLSTCGNVVDYGDDIGAANVVKLCGNFLIATSIESIAEAMALAEKHGVERTEVMKLLSSTIFDCLIYKGYGQRVSERDHRPGGFALNLGMKDMTLVRKAAIDGDVPMPFLSVLLDRFTSAKAKGRDAFDWSAIGLNSAEDAGIDISKDIEKNLGFIASDKKLS